MRNKVSVAIKPPVWHPAEAKYGRSPLRGVSTAATGGFSCAVVQVALQSHPAKLLARSAQMESSGRHDGIWQSPRHGMAYHASRCLVPSTSAMRDRIGSLPGTR